MVHQTKRYSCITPRNPPPVLEAYQTPLATKAQVLLMIQLYFIDLHWPPGKKYTCKQTCFLLKVRVKESLLLAFDTKPKHLKFCILPQFRYQNVEQKLQVIF